MNELNKTFECKSVEDKWYKTWSSGGYFRPKKSDKGSFSLIMPPPNVTGKLHMGHALDHTLQDVIVRHKRMQGLETLWIPGQDHAGIATQAKVEKKVYEEEGKTKHDLGRSEFLKRIWKWKEENGNEITEQIKRIGDSCDWDYFTFTMDSGPEKAVKKFFVDLYNEGLIYQDDYIINWDPVLQSAISDAEVEHKEVDGNFYSIQYKISGTSETLTIATTRPETLFGDSAVCVNPNDDRYEHLIGKMAIIPLIDKEVPIIADDYVDMDFGTGCLKVTPGHDFNDFEIGKRHKLPCVDILNDDGTFNENALPIKGLKGKEARKKTKNLLSEAGVLLEVKPHKHQVGVGQRSNEVIEPRVSRQWFINTEEMAKKSVEALEQEKMKFFPKGWENTYFAYQKNPRPWCISRQLWWGHQIPVFYCEECGHTWASSQEESECEKCKSSKVKQDQDSLDTWFSSGLFPLSTLGWPDPQRMKELQFDKFYPTSTLVTGFDIIFFWVARMMMMCEKATGKIPFSDTYIHAIVRDKNGVKMSKSLGNVIDPIEVIEQYGCDALRFTLAISSGYNRNINLDTAKIEGYRNFINKIWNAFRFVYPYLENANDEAIDFGELHHHEKWIISELNSVVDNVNKSFAEYRFDDASNAIYHFVYEKFCSWFIELSKGVLNSNSESSKQQRANVLKYALKNIVKLLHPICPFITEELWSSLKKDSDDLLIASEFPIFNKDLAFKEDEKQMHSFIEAVTAIRNLRNSVSLSPKEEVEVHFFTDDEATALYLYKSRGFLKELAKVKAGKIKDRSITRPKKSVLKTTSDSEVFLLLDGVIDIDAYKLRLEKGLAKLEAEHAKLDKKLSNEKFTANAPIEVVEEVKAKAADLKAQVDAEKNILETL